MTFYEKTIDLDEIGVLWGIELLLTNYRYWLSWEDGCALIDRYWKLISKINLKEIKNESLVIQCWGVWQAPFCYNFNGDFTSPISYSTQHYDTL